MITNNLFINLGLMNLKKRLLTTTLKKYYLVCCLIIWLSFLALPSYTLAAVIINEVAWMMEKGEDWLELHATEIADLSGWKIIGERYDGVDRLNLEIELADSISANDYMVIETNLINSGLDLRLYDNTDSLRYTVIGGKNWEDIGGDNETKKTAQYISEIDDWVTATATPGRANINPSPDTESPDPNPPQNPDPDPGPKNKTNKSSNKSKPKSGDQKTTKLKLPNHTLKLQINAPEIVYVNQPVNFSVTSSGIAEQLLPSVKYSWNYGDAYTGSGNKPQHRYAYPGTYVVLLAGAFARHNSLARHEITVRPVVFSITRSDAGAITIHNDATGEVNISGYTLGSESNIFTFSAHTIITKGGAITLPEGLLKSPALAPLALRDSAGVLVAVYPALSAELGGIIPSLEPVTITPRQPAPALQQKTAPVLGLAPSISPRYGCCPGR